jgi:hypothetical protein
MEAGRVLAVYTAFSVYCLKKAGSVRDRLKGISSNLAKLDVTPFI